MAEATSQMCSYGLCINPNPNLPASNLYQTLAWAQHYAACRGQEGE